MLETARRAALEAGSEILNVYQKEDYQIETKEDESPLTIADRRAHQRIIDILEKTGIPVLSEEGGEIPFEDRKLWNQFWLIDPLDGTKEFIKRNGEFTVNIALIDGSKPVLGVVYAPWLDLMYTGSFETGARRLEHASTTDSADEGIVIHSPASLEKEGITAVVSRSHMNKATEQFIENLESQFGKIRSAEKGSSLKLCLVAEGSADVYPRFAPTMEWDTAAGDAVCRAAGCFVVKVNKQYMPEQDAEKSLSNFFTGPPLIYNKQDMHNPWFITFAPCLTNFL
ncbi:MAG: 3'(2'),5'-bisphosphate nucleotidase CysQ [Spirochaetales bacterium]|nr:3'(2'),5'-bisphosphate nucleotidase CysQ [Spirochaetales bacterium]